MTVPRLASFLALVSVALLLGGTRASAVLAPGTSSRTLDFGGQARSYRVRVPSRYDGSTAVPLVLDLHGFTSNGSQQEALSGMKAVAERETFIVVWPEGLRNAWNAGICCGNQEIDDVGFLRAVVAAVEAEASVDPTRVYATGLSNGGAMSQRLGCDAADLFAAVAPMAFPVPFEPLSKCQPSRAIPVLTFMGLTDKLVAYAGNLFPSAPETFAYWRDVDGCGTGEPEQREEKGMSRCETYTRCTDGVQVGLCSITAQAFPGAFFDGHVLYLNPDFILADVAWGFLSRFQLPEVSPPVRAVVTGPATLALRGKGKRRDTLRWTVTLGDGTWGAVDEAGKAYSGSARRRGRRVVLGLTGDSEDVLLAALGEQVSQLVGGNAAVTPARAPRLGARVGGRGRRVTLGGHVVLRNGTARALYTFRLKGAAL